MSKIVRKIYGITPPLDRFAVITFIVIDWMYQHDFDFTMYDPINDWTLFSQLMVKKDAFRANCDGFEFNVSFSEIMIEEPVYQITFVVCNVFYSIHIKKTKCPLFLNQNRPPKNECLFVRELQIILNTVVLEGILTRKLKGLKPVRPYLFDGPNSFFDQTLSISPTQSSPAESRSILSETSSSSPSPRQVRQVRPVRQVRRLHRQIQPRKSRFRSRSPLGQAR